MIDIYLIIGLCSLSLLFVNLFTDIDGFFGHELEFSSNGTLLGLSFSSFLLYYLQNYITNNIILSILGIFLFFIGYKLLVNFVDVLRKGERGDVLSIKDLVNKIGKILHSYEKENEFFYEIEIDNNKYIAKANSKLDLDKAIIVTEINQLDELIIINIQVNIDLNLN